MNVSATQSGTLLKPLMFGMVIGSFLGGQLTYRLRSYKIQGVVGAILVAGGMIFFAHMSGSTERSVIVYGMALAGLGMGLMQTTYTVAVQNSAPPPPMATAPPSPLFFPSLRRPPCTAAFVS